MQIKELYKKFLKAKGSDIKYRNLTAGKKIDVSKKGLWDKNKKQVIVPSNRITMKGPNGEQDFFKKPVVATGLQSGQKVVMQPGGEYYFPNDRAVHEVRMQDGGLSYTPYTRSQNRYTDSPVQKPVVKPRVGDVVHPNYEKLYTNLIIDSGSLAPGLVGYGFNAASILRGVEDDDLNQGLELVPGKKANILSIADDVAKIQKAKPYVYKGKQMQKGGWLGEYQSGGSVQTEMTTPIHPKDSPTQDAFNTMMDKYEASKTEEPDTSPEKMGFNLGGDVPTVIDALFANYSKGLGKKYAQKGSLVVGDYDKTLAPKEGNYLQPDINRPYYIDEEGNKRSEYKMGIRDKDGKEVLIPTVVNGKQLTEDEAIARYHETGLHMGKFDSPQESDYNARLRTAKYNMLENPVEFSASQFQGGGYTYSPIPSSIRIGNNPSTTDNTYAPNPAVMRAKVAQGQALQKQLSTPEGKLKMAAAKKRAENNIALKKKAEELEAARKKAAQVSEMQNKIDESIAVQDLPFSEQFTPENMAKATQATGDKLRLFGPMSPLVTSGLVDADPNSLFDEYINPAKMAGDMVRDLGAGTSEAIKTKSLSPLVAPVLAPVAMGALGALGSKAKAAPQTNFNRMAMPSTSVYTPPMMPSLRQIANRDINTQSNLQNLVNQIVTTSRFNNSNAPIIRELSPEQISQLMRRGSAQEAQELAEREIRQKAKRDLYDYSKIPTYDAAELETAVNKNLEQGYGIVSPEFSGTPLKVKINTNPAEPHKLTIIPQYGDNTIGRIELDQNIRPYFKGDRTGISEWGNTPGFRKTNDFPYGFVPNEVVDKTGIPKYSGLSVGDKNLYQQDFYGSGISGELNKAVNEALKERNLGNILSGGTGHSVEGKLRWEGLVNKGKAVKLGEDEYKLLMLGGMSIPGVNGTVVASSPSLYTKYKKKK